MTITYTLELARETDEELARLHGQYGETWARITDVEHAAHRTAGDERKYLGYGRRGDWQMSLEDALAKAPAESATRDALLKRLAEVSEAMKPLDAIWEEHRWSRYWVVWTKGLLGHIHASEGCHTLNNGQYRTNLEWRTKLSGESIKTAIADPDLGPVLCQHCFPSASAEYKRDPAEVNRERNKAVRDAERAAKAAALAPKMLDPETEAFRSKGGAIRGEKITKVTDCLRLIRDAMAAEVELELWESGAGGERYVAEAARFHYDPDPGFPARMTEGARERLAEKRADAGEATRVLLAREQQHEGWGITKADLAKLKANAEKKARKDRRLPTAPARPA